MGSAAPGRACRQVAGHQADRQQAAGPGQRAGDARRQQGFRRPGYPARQPPAGRPGPRAPPDPASPASQTEAAAPAFVAPGGVRVLREGAGVPVASEADPASPASQTKAAAPAVVAPGGVRVLREGAGVPVASQADPASPASQTEADAPAVMAPGGVRVLREGADVPVASEADPDSASPPRPRPRLPGAGRCVCVPGLPHGACQPARGATAAVASYSPWMRSMPSSLDACRSLLPALTAGEGQGCRLAAPCPASCSGREGPPRPLERRYARRGTLLGDALPRPGQSEQRAPGSRMRSSRPRQAGRGQEMGIPAEPHLPGESSHWRKAPTRQGSRHAMPACAWDTHPGLAARRTAGHAYWRLPEQCAGHGIKARPRPGARVHARRHHARAVQVRGRCASRRAAATPGPATGAGAEPNVVPLSCQPRHGGLVSLHPCAHKAGGHSPLQGKGRARARPAVLCRPACAGQQRSGVHPGQHTA